MGYAFSKILLCNSERWTCPTIVCSMVKQFWNVFKFCAKFRYHCIINTQKYRLYAGLAGANKLLSVENVNEMLQEIKGKLHSEADKSKRILSTLKGNLSRIDGNMPQGDPISWTDAFCLYILQFYSWIFLYEEFIMDKN